MDVDVQLNPATSPWPLLREAACAAEQAGFDTVWAWDHLTGRLLGGDTMLECFTLLGALAAATSRIGLGSLVVNVLNRNPGLMAVAAASVQTLSGGRFRLGLGAGAAPRGRTATEQHAVGLAVPGRLADRHHRLEGALDLLDAMWTTERDPRWNGFPLPHPRPPVLLGVNSVELAALAGRRTQGVNVRADHPELAALLRAAAGARARAVAGPPARSSAELGDAGPDGWTTSVWAPWADALLDPGAAERRRLAALGVDRLVLVWLGPADPDRLAAAGARLR